MILMCLGLFASQVQAAPRRLHLVPLGSVPLEVLDFLETKFPREFDAAVLRQKEVPVPAQAYVPLRRQYRAEAFLTLLASWRQDEKDVVLGVTAVDLFVPSLNFVFGLADPSRRLAIISLARLDPQFYGQPAHLALMQERALKEAVHELGHLFGLSHCPESHCIMFFSNTLADTDHKGPGFCPECQGKLKK